MASDSVCAAGVAFRDVDNAAPCAAQDCSDVVHISVFFDGTGNNKDSDEVTKSWSNVARIWRSARMFSNDNGAAHAYPIYVAGVGTPFNGKALFPGDGVRIAAEDTDIAGGSAGAGGSRRLTYGHHQINDALRDALLGKAKILGGKVAKYAEAGQQQSFSDVNKALGQHRLIKQINVSIFGFSRGAALARAFCNEWLWQCEENRGKLSYEGYPIRFVFLGLFDTVASFGLPAANKPNHALFGGFKGRDLVVDERVERCVHQVAAHELRFAFPVDLIRNDGGLAGNWVEKVYPGVHSDVGGGYEPDAQGIKDNYSRIPMRDMMREALLHGTRILGYDDIKARSFRIFQERFQCKPETEAAFQAYTAICDPEGSVEEQVKMHMEQLYSAFGSLHRQGRESVTQREHRAGTSWSQLAPDDMAKELESYERAKTEILKPEAAFRDPLYSVRQGLYALWIAPSRWQMEAWERTADDGVMNFVHTYIHDSKVGFLANAEPFSYFSKRGINESMHSIQGWFEESVERPVDKAYEATVDAANRGVEKTKEVATKTYDTVAEKAQQAKEAVAEAAEEARKEAMDAAQKAQEAIAEKAQQARQVAVETANKVQQAAVETGKKVSETISNAAQKGQQALQSAGEAVGRTTQEAVNGLKTAWANLF